MSGSNGQTVRIPVAPTDLINAVGRQQLPFTPLAPATITLTNSGAPGTDFNIGGSIAIPSTADGTYRGNVEVTVDYQYASRLKLEPPKSLHRPHVHHRAFEERQADRDGRGS